MISQVLSQMATRDALIPLLMCLGLVLFLSVFFGVLIWTGRRQNQALYQAMSHKPLEEEKS